MAKESRLNEQYATYDYWPEEWTPPERELTPEGLPGVAYLAAAVAVGLILIMLFVLAAGVYVLFIQ